MTKKSNPKQIYKGNPEAMKWPSNKKQYDINYLRIFGKKCPICKCTGGSGALRKWICCCSRCDGIGYVEKGKWEK